MHEHGLAREVLDRMERKFLAGHEGARVKALHLSVREDSGIDAHFLEHGLEEEAPATIFEGASFTVTQRTLELVCAKCGSVIPEERFGYGCGRCGGIEVRPKGEEIEFEGIVWEDA